MDTEKEKAAPEKSNPEPINDDHNLTEKDSSKHPLPENPPPTSAAEPSKTDIPEDIPKKEIADQPQISKSEINADEQTSNKEILDQEEQPKPDINADGEIPPDKEIQDQEEQPADEKAEETEPTPLPPPDLGQVSQEIDGYISTLSNFQGGKGEGDESTPPPDVPICVEQFAVLVEAKIESYDSSETHVKWSQLTDDDASSFLEAIDRMLRLSNALSKFSLEEKYASSINRIGGVFQRGMSYLEEEFRALLEDHKVSSDADNNNNDSKSKQSAASAGATQDADQDPVPEAEPVEESDFPGYPEEVVSKLSKLAKILILGDHETECCQIYFIARRTALEKSLNELGFEKHSIDDLHKMNWESLEREIVAWNRTFKECATIYFSNEHKLSDAVFEGYPSLSVSLFSNLSRGIMIQLLNFYEAVAMTKRAAEKLFKFLDIYESLRDLLPKMENLFPPDCMDEIKSEATLTQGRLGEATISIFSELENSIKADSAKTPVPGGAVHPLTRYVLNYLKYACEYKDTLEQVFRGHQKIERAESSASEFDHHSHPENSHNANVAKVKQSPFEIEILKVMNLLDSNLEAKSKLYKEQSLNMIFLMNNGRYILQKIKSSAEISSLLGDTWSRKRSSELRNYHKSYQRDTWGKLLNCLMNHEGLNVNGKVVKPVLKERFKSFNAMFEEIHKTQCTWIISDEQLQSELRVSISNMVVPAYRSFMGRFSQYFTPGRQTEKYIKFQPEDVESYIDELFDGNAAAPMAKKGW